MTPIPTCCPDCGGKVRVTKTFRHPRGVRFRKIRCCTRGCAFELETEERVVQRKRLYVSEKFAPIRT